MSKDLTPFDMDADPKFDEENSLSVELGDLPGKLDANGSETVIKKAIGMEFWFAMTLVIVGGLIVLFGIILFILGITDRINLELTSDKFTAKIVNGSPGVLVTIVGGWIIARAKFEIKK